MTEPEWLACSDPEPMLAHLCGRRIYGRKLRLFACACCRLSWDWLKDERSRKAVELVELFVDRRAKKHELVSASAAARAVVIDLLQRSRTTLDRARDLEIEINVADAAWRTSALDSIHRCIVTIASRSRFTEPHYGADGGKGAAQVRLLLDIFGQPYPFPQLRVSEKPLTQGDGVVERLAQSIYDEGKFEGLPILADALLHLGCETTEILKHCRSSGPHVRGCWVVDLVLGKE